MSAHTSPLTNVLVGSLSGTTDETRLRARFEAAGGDPSNLDLLSSTDDVQGQVLSAGGGGSIARLWRRVSLAMDDTAGSRLDMVRRDLARGRCVMVLRGVERDDVASMAARLQSLGADDLRYSGRWTSTVHGTAVGSVAAT
jgi:hypothetical protein